MTRARSSLLTPEANRTAASPILHRACACGNHSSAGGECQECRKRSGRLRLDAMRVGASEIAPPIVHEALRTSARPLDSTTRTFFEARLDHDLSGVRVHAGTTEMASAAAISARAYTVGHDIVFGAGEYAPATSEGRALLAHELVHYVQQSDVVGVASSGLRMSKPGDADEKEAAEAARDVLSGSPTVIRAAASAPKVHGFWISTEPAGGCGICYDMVEPGRGPAAAGRVAHRVIQAAFLGSLRGGAWRFVEFPFRSPTDDSGSLDLAIATPTGFRIAEIKPHTEAGEQAGIRDLDWYRTQIQLTHPNSTVELIDDVPIPAGLAMPDPIAAASGCGQQGLSAMLMGRPGLYGYFCQPPYSQARPACRCAVPPGTRQPASERQGQRTEGERRITERVREPQAGARGEREPRPAPVEEPAPVPEPGAEVIPFPGRTTPDRPAEPAEADLPVAAREGFMDRLRQTLINIGVPAALIAIVVAAIVVPLLLPEPVVSKIAAGLAAVLGIGVIAATAMALIIIRAVRPSGSDTSA